MFLILILVGIGWLYVAVLMAVAEAHHSSGSVLGAIMTFLLYGLGPVALVLYILATPLRRKLRRQREADEEAASASAAPDAGGQASTDAVTPVRKEP